MKKNLFKKFFEYDKYIQNHQKNSLIKQSIIASTLISITLFVFSIINLVEKSYLMLYVTFVCLIIDNFGIFISIKTKNTKWTNYISILLCLIAFTIFLISGKNDGVGSLWLIIFPCISILLFDAKFGFISSCYFLLLLIVCFWTPINTLLPYAYSQAYLMRLPLLYMTSFGLSIYVAYIIRHTQYKLIIEKEHLFIEKNIDKMTQLYNRTKYEEDMLNVYPKCKSIGIILFDINFLKLTNDNFGHLSGDKIIINTAKSIKNSLKENQFAYRISGDEFVVILPNSQKNDCANFIDFWKSNFDLINKNEGNILYSVAYGYGFGDTHFDIKEVLKQADNEIYNCKVEEEKKDIKRIENLIKKTKEK